MLATSRRFSFMCSHRHCLAQKRHVKTYQSLFTQTIYFHPSFVELSPRCITTDCAGCEEKEQESLHVRCVAARSGLKYTELENCQLKFCIRQGRKIKSEISEWAVTDVQPDTLKKKKEKKKRRKFYFKPHERCFSCRSPNKQQSSDIWTWTGAKYSHQHVSSPLTSSGKSCHSAVTGARREINVVVVTPSPVCFVSLRINVSDLIYFFHSYQPSRALFAFLCISRRRKSHYVEVNGSTVKNVSIFLHAPDVQLAFCSSISFR